MPYQQDNGTFSGEIGDCQQDRSPKKVLVVDDDHDVRLLHNLVLIHGGYCADMADNGAVAWGMLRRNHYDLLITDHEMPKLSGVDLLQKINASRMKLPVIMVTEVFPEFEFRGRPWLQPSAALLKPVTGEDLLRVVQRVLGAAGGSEPIASG
jgi:DNA-binding response OmpR family regulator